MLKEFGRLLFFGVCGFLMLFGIVVSRAHAQSLEQELRVVDSAIQQSCSQSERRTDMIAGALVGAVLGAALESGNNRGRGAVLGGIGGASIAAANSQDECYLLVQRRQQLLARIAAQQPREQVHCEQAFQGGQWVLVNCRRSVDQIRTLGAMPDWVPR